MISNTLFETSGITSLCPGDLIRPLGPMEQFFYVADESYPTHFALTAQIEGCTTREAWRAALDAVQQRHPLFSVCIDAKANPTRHFRHVTGTPIPLRIVPGGAQIDWESEMERELATPFYPERAPLVRAVLLHERDRADFILTAHHSIADGLSLSFAIRDTLRALSGEPLDPLPVRLSQEELLGLTGRAPIEAAPESRANAAAAVKPTTDRDRMHSTPCITRLRLTPELTGQLRERARREETTVHGALISALVLAGRQVCPEWRERAVCVLSPIEIRSLLNQGEDCAVRTSAGLGSVAPDVYPDFWEIARRAKRDLAGAQTLEGVTATLGVIDEVARRGLDREAAEQMLEQGFAHDILLTNLGNLRYETGFGALKLKALWGPAVMGQGNRQTIGVATANGVLCLLHTSQRPIPSLLEAAEQILISACLTCRENEY